MWHALAVSVNLSQASHLHRVLEVNVLTEADLLVEHLSPTYAGQLVPLVLQAADDTG